MASKLNEGSEFTIPLKNLIALIAVTGIAVWDTLELKKDCLCWNTIRR